MHAHLHKDDSTVKDDMHFPTFVKTHGNQHLDIHPSQSNHRPVVNFQTDVVKVILHGWPMERKWNSIVFKRPNH